MIAMYLNKITSACREIKRPKMNLGELIAHYVQYFRSLGTGFTSPLR